VRTVDRVLSVLLALALIALAVLIPIEVVYALADGSGSLVLPYQPVAEFLRDRAWSSGPVIAISVVVAALGLALVLAELWRRRPGVFTVATGTDAVTAGISRRSLARALTHAATDVPGVTHASASVSRRRAVVDAATPLRDPGDLAERAQQRVEALMASLALTRPVPTRVRLRRRGEPG
jgi:putative intracellular protease/amidase